MASRDLTLAPRVEGIRDKQFAKGVVEFDLVQIKEHFDQNLTSIGKQFDIAESMQARLKSVKPSGDLKLFFWKVH